jgi:hypothetical protein
MRGREQTDPRPQRTDPGRSKRIPAAASRSPTPPGRSPTLANRSWPQQTDSGRSKQILAAADRSWPQRAEILAAASRFPTAADKSRPEQADPGGGKQIPGGCEQIPAVASSSVAGTDRALPVQSAPGRSNQIPAPNDDASRVPSPPCRFTVLNFPTSIRSFHSSIRVQRRTALACPRSRSTPRVRASSSRARCSARITGMTSLRHSATTIGRARSGTRDALDPSRSGHQPV